MSGPSFAEFLILCLIGLIVLGPKRLPEVANTIGKWVGQARRMTRVMKRQLEEELDLEKKPQYAPPSYPPPAASETPVAHPPPHDDDTYSPLHDEDDDDSGADEEPDGQRQDA